MRRGTTPHTRTMASSSAFRRFRDGLFQQLDAAALAVAASDGRTSEDAAWNINGARGMHRAAVEWQDSLKLTVLLQRSLVASDASAAHNLDESLARQFCVNLLGEKVERLEVDGVESVAALECLEIVCHSEWPLNIVLNSEANRAFSKLAVLLLQVKRAVNAGAWPRVWCCDCVPFPTRPSHPSPSWQRAVRDAAQPCPM